MFVLGIYTLIRVLVLIAVAAAVIWVPVGIWIGMNPRWAGRLQAVAQFLAAFPVNLVFPFAVVGIVHWPPQPEHLALAADGAGHAVVPALQRDRRRLDDADRAALRGAEPRSLSGWLRWRRYLLPAVFPSFVTGAITASGGSWNASIVAEYVTWGDTTLQAEGLGSYIRQMTTRGDFPRIALGIGVMSVFVMAMNHFVWRRLYRLAEERMHF